MVGYKQEETNEMKLFFFLLKMKTNENKCFRIYWWLSPTYFSFKKKSLAYFNFRAANICSPKNTKSKLATYTYLVLKR